MTNAALPLLRQGKNVDSAARAVADLLVNDRIQAFGTYAVPREICDFLNGDAGLLPLNPNEGETIRYS